MIPSIPGVAPLSVGWVDVVDHLVAERGSLAEVARALMDATPSSAGLPTDPTTVERGLRRLRQRHNAEGDKYGRAILRAFGMPASISEWARALGQYHSRLSDLSVPVRQDLLRLWDRPPISESKSAIWIHLAIATLAHRTKDHEQMTHRLQLGRQGLPLAEPAARMEAFLFEARLTNTPEPFLDRASTELPLLPTGSTDRLCYEARIFDQRAYHAARNSSGRVVRPEAARAWYARIDSNGPPFVRFRRTHGLAWCAHRLGNKAEAVRMAEDAVSAAGDGGLLRFRCMALTLLGQISRETSALSRALWLAQELQDDALIQKVQRALRFAGSSRASIPPRSG